MFNVDAYQKHFTTKRHLKVGELTSAPWVNYDSMMDSALPPYQENPFETIYAFSPSAPQLIYSNICRQCLPYQVIINTSIKSNEQ